MSLLIYPYTQGKAFIIGLTSDVKPSNLSSGSIFLESDTYKLYSSTGTGWMNLEHSGQINSVAQSNFAIVFSTPLPLPYVLNIEILDPTTFTVSRTAYTTLKTANGFTIRLSIATTCTIIWNAKKL